MKDSYSKVLLTLIFLLLAYDALEKRIPEAYAANGIKKGYDQVSNRRVVPMPVVNCYKVPGTGKKAEWSCGLPGR